MKKRLWILIGLLAAILYGQGSEGKAASVKLNAKNFPEVYFRHYIGMLYDENGDGELSDAERAKVTEIDVGRFSDYRATYEYPSVQTLKGIEYFPNLEILSCYSNALRKLDVSKNRKLKELNCSSNAIKSLNVKNNKKLKKLICNYNEIKRLNVKNNKELRRLYCSENKLKSIDISNNRKLEDLEVAANGLKEMDVSRLKELKRLSCIENEISKLDVSKNSKLSLLACSRNEIEKLNLKQNKLLDTLYCYDNQLTKLDLSRNRMLQYLYCKGNHLVTGSLKISRTQFEIAEVYPQKQTIRAKRIGKRTYIPLTGVTRTNEITHLSTGVVTERGIRLNGKKLPKKITYEYNMFTDGEEMTEVEIKVKKERKRKNK